MEFVRRNDALVAGLTEAQLLSLVMIGAGLIWLRRAARSGGLRREPVQPSVAATSPA